MAENTANTARPVNPRPARARARAADPAEPLRRHLTDHIVPLVSAHLGTLLDQPRPTLPDPAPAAARSYPD